MRMIDISSVCPLRSAAPTKVRPALVVYPVFPPMIPGYRFISSLSWFAIANDSRFLPGGRFRRGMGVRVPTNWRNNGNWRPARKMVTSSSAVLTCPSLSSPLGLRITVSFAPSLAASAFISAMVLSQPPLAFAKALAASLPLEASGREADPSRCNWRRVGYRLGCRQPSHPVYDQRRWSSGRVWDHGQRCERLCCAGLWEAMLGTLRREDFARLSVGDDPGVGVKFGRWSGTGDW